MSDLQKILDLFGLEFHNCKFNGEELPKLALVVDPNKQDMSATLATTEFRSLPAVAFNVSILSGSEYANISVLDADGLSDKDGWDLFNGKGYCCYNHRDKTVYVGYPYPYGKGADLPVERAILHELGHYKQDVLYGANIETCNNLILEYHNIMFNENRSQTKFEQNSKFGIENYRITYDKIKGAISVLGMQKIDVFSNDFLFNVEASDLYYIVQIGNKSAITRVKIDKSYFNNAKNPKDSDMLGKMENLMRQSNFKASHILFINMLNDLYKEKYLSYTKL